LVKVFIGIFGNHFRRIYIDFLDEWGHR
jgi:hypothetical protein